MKIGELAKATSCKAETIRYYERIGLLAPPERTDGNYRDFGSDDAERIAFIRRARGLGFEIADIRSLLGLDEKCGMNRDEAERIANGHLAAVEEKLALLKRLRSELRLMISECGAGEIPNRRLLNSLADNEKR